MASIAIDPNEIRTAEAAQSAGAEPARRGRGLMAVGVLGGAAAIVAAGWAAYGHLPTFPRLGGLASIVEPPRPARTDIRIGAFPAMPEIRDGVPALVEPRPVRVVGTAPTPPSGPNPPTVASAGRPAGVAPARAASLLSPSLSAPASMAAVEPARRIDGPSGSGLLPATPTGPVASAPVAPPEPQAAAAATPMPVARVASAEATARIEPAALPTARLDTAGLRSEPAETAALTPVTPRVASLPPTASPIAVPLPPPAPQRFVRAPETERSVAPARTAARPKAAPAPDAIAVAAAPAPMADEATDDRLEVLGVKLPNGRDIGNALSALGDSVKNLPKSF